MFLPCKQSHHRSYDNCKRARGFLKGIKLVNHSVMDMLLSPKLKKIPIGIKKEKPPHQVHFPVEGIFINPPLLWALIS